MGTLKTNEEIKKEISESVEELSWVVEGGDAHDLQDSCDKAHACLADTLALIERLESDASFYKNISALMDKTNGEALSLIDSLIESNLKRAEKIEQLKAQNAELSENIMWMEAERDDHKRTIQQLQAENDRLTDEVCNAYNIQNEQLARIRQLEAERDAAVADLEHVKDCDSCKYDDACFTGKKDCFGCHEKRCPCLTCQYEWRGVTKEETNDQ